MNIQLRKDGHIHSPFCPHGTKDSLDLYVENAINKNLEEISFTEHMPFPTFCYDKVFLEECALNDNQVLNYIESVNEIKNKYKDKIRINVGFEVDYIDGLENETKKILDKYGKYIEDSILSVHFVKYQDEYYPIDWNKGFKMLLDKTKSIEKVYDLYFETILKSIKADLGDFKPKRIGHCTLIRIFNNLYPFEYQNEKLIKEISSELKNNNYEIDVNTAGLRKPYCKEMYPSGIMKKYIEEYNIPCIYGSDSHNAKDVGRDFILK